MEEKGISQDDLLDVMETTKKLESYIGKMFKNNDPNIAISALMSASINSMLIQCKTLDDVMFYRNMFVQAFDSSIRSIKLKD